ncbi:UDP-N-acetylmuramate:L-alanyl-gamma-D-glutamyl-meso-diaminopimelate ligase [Pokkaliibacter sp. CJK22405]|uniref:UDP-N-acetylmuramate:L-alanyl-gamma-D-glutamyl- meso-diaminopimelate ligase n=1 Tax=Pokkaliibacter sp. CJK22405 TaxID=3384615 RepID=UPI003984C154
MADFIPAPQEQRASAPRHLHILGICGTFMGSLAVLARALGYKVSGSDANVYPPMSTQLQEAGIDLCEGYLPENIAEDVDLVIIGNALSRGNPAVEYVLDKGISYVSGPQWLADHVLPGRWVLAVSGTHGKTTTSAMLAWILDYAGMAPGFLIGGVPGNFPQSARLGETPFFVIEADEYDSAFFDKRSKFVHYRPRTLIMNNLEFDHADIFADLAAIQTQFHHLVRTVPASGRLISPAGDAALDQVLARGCWSEHEYACTTGQEAVWHVEPRAPDGSDFTIFYHSEPQGHVQWALTGEHNMHNALHAIAAAHHVGVVPSVAIEALCAFTAPKRRMELKGTPGGVSVYDDFAHHPTAIRLTLEGLRKRVGDSPIVALIEPRSNTMRLGTHKAQLAESVACANQVFWYQPPGLDWSLLDVIEQGQGKSTLATDIDALVEQVARSVSPDTHVVIMSNGGFAGIHNKLLLALDARFGQEKL